MKNILRKPIFVAQYTYTYVFHKKHRLYKCALCMLQKLKHVQCLKSVVLKPAY